MMWSLPTFVEIDGKDYAIRNNCDYRVVLDVIEALNDRELEHEHRLYCALFIFYENLDEIKDFNKACEEMLKIVNLGEETTDDNKPKLMDWKHDYNQIIPSINRVLGYSVRDVNKYTHWWDFIGAYMEIGESTFSTIIGIRNKRYKGKKLEKWEQEFYQENKKLVDLPQELTEDDKEWLTAE